MALLGSTGSIGRQTVDVLTSAADDRFSVVALAAGRDADTLSDQAARLRPRVVAMGETGAAARLRLPDGATLLDAPDAMTQMAIRDDVDMVIVATGGVVSLRPVLAALEAGKVVATANKETLVSAGHLVMPLARARAAEVAATDPGVAAGPGRWPGCGPSTRSTRPSGSAWPARILGSVARLILTASGGPFREWPAASLAAARPADALAHPTWDMGAKITIDSATLMNKGLEVIEAHWLYDVAYEHIEVIIHPQSLVHSLVEFVDGSQKAQLGLPDMRIPIQYALSYPQRVPGPAPRLDLVEHSQMTFAAPDERALPGPRHRPCRRHRRSRRHGGAHRRRRHRRGALPGRQPLVHGDGSPRGGGRGPLQRVPYPHARRTSRRSMPKYAAGRGRPTSTAGRAE